MRMSIRLLFRLCASVCAFLGCAVLLVGCAAVSSDQLYGVEGPNTPRLPKSNGLIAFKNKVAVAAAASNEVKEADAFYILIFNESDRYVEYDPKAVTLLDASGKEHGQVSESRLRQLKRRYTLKPPIGFKGDVFSQRGPRLDRGDRASPLNPADVFSSKVMPESRYEFYVFFPRVSAGSEHVHLKIPKMIHGAGGEELVYIFRFEKQTP